MMGNHSTDDHVLIYIFGIWGNVCLISMYVRVGTCIISICFGD